MLQPGSLAPDFQLESTAGPFMLSAHRGSERVLVIFYPMDNTSG